jgi:hypothetical protein
MSVVNHIYDIDHVKFISYTGKYPNLCRGVLTLEIDGEEVKFGHDYSGFESWLKDGNYEGFWTSGGSCCFYDSHYQETRIDTGEWKIDFQSIPEKYRKYAYEIDEVFNSNVQYGCCGGCI